MCSTLYSFYISFHFLPLNCCYLRKENFFSASLFVSPFQRMPCYLMSLFRKSKIFFEWLLNFKSKCSNLRTQKLLKKFPMYFTSEIIILSSKIGVWLQRINFLQHMNICPGHMFLTKGLCTPTMLRICADRVNEEKLTFRLFKTQNV